MTDDKRLIEHYLPIKAISAEASPEKSVGKGHVWTLHLWSAQRPLVACRVESPTDYRDPVHGVRRIEVKGRKKGQPIRLTTNEWYKAQQLGDSFWLYVVWSPLEKPDPVPVMIQNPAKHLEHAAKSVVSARFWDIPAEVIGCVAEMQCSVGNGGIV